MDYEKLTHSLNRLVPGWEYHTTVHNAEKPILTAFKDGMCFVVFVDMDGSINVRGVYPKELSDEALKAAPRSKINPNKSEEEVAIHIAGVFLPKYQGMYSILSGKAKDAIERRYSLAKRLKEASGDFVAMGNETLPFPELSAHAGWMDLEMSVRSEDLVYMELVIPTEVAEEIVRHLSWMKGGGNARKLPEEDRDAYQEATDG